jgi:AraC-like DNA-binding protein
MAGTDAELDPGTTPQTLVGMLGGMRAAGLDVDAIYAATGLSEAALAGRKESMGIRELVPVWRHAAKQFGRGTVGLFVGAGVSGGSLLEYLVSATPDLRAALGQIARYIGLATRSIHWVVGPRDADGLTTFEERATYAPEVIPPMLREFGLALTAKQLRNRFDRTPREVWFTHPSQGPREDYQQVFGGCPVYFERDRMALRFDDEALATPAKSHDPQLFRLLESHAERVLAETPATSTFRDRVGREVVRRLRAGEPGMGAVASALATSERSLQRKLQAEGASFRDVVDEARHKLAMVYLGDHSLSMTDVACLLGYSEAAAFTRAFKRWTGNAPSHARR